MADNEQHQPASSGPPEPAVTPAQRAAPPPDGSPAPGQAGPAASRSMWADLITGPHQDDQPERGEPGHRGPDEGVPGWQAPGWPVSPLPPSFGQRPVEGEKPVFDDPAPAQRATPARPRAGRPWVDRPAVERPPAEPPPVELPWAEPSWTEGGWAEEAWPDQLVPGQFVPGQAEAEPERSGYRPLDQPVQAAPGAQPAPESYRPAHARPAGERAGQPGPQGASGRAADGTGGAAQDNGYRPWETYEPAAGPGWTGGYGIIADEEPPAPSQGEPPAAPGPARPPAAFRPDGPAAVLGPDEPGAALRQDRPGAVPDGDDGHAGHLQDATCSPPYDGIPPEDCEREGYARALGEPADGDGGGDGAAAYLGYGFVAPADEAEEPGRPTWQTGSADSLTADVLLPGRHATPPAGWRRALYQLTGGLVRAPESAADRRRVDLVARARTPVAGGHHRVAVLSLKGGVGKTTTTVGLGATLASLRGDRIIALDANPDRGTLCDKLRLETAATVRDLLNESGQIRRYADVRGYTTQAPSGLEVLASDRDPTVSVAFSDQDYADVAQVLEHYYSVCVTDCGTGLLHSAMAGVLRLTDQIVLVSSPSVDGARSASATLDWLAAHQYGDLVRGAVVVLSAIRPRSKSTVDLARLEQHFAARCRAVVRIPYDAHLEEGAEVDLARLSRATADAYLVLAAEVGDGFAWQG